MNSDIAVALIALLGTLLGSFCGILAANRLTNYRIEQLEKKVEKHNGLVERTYRLEGEMLEMQRILQVASHRASSEENNVSL